MEKEMYREHLALIKERFGDQTVLTVNEAADYIGLCDRILRRDHSFPMKKIGGRYYVTIVDLARWLA